MTQLNDISIMRKMICALTANRAFCLGKLSIRFASKQSTCWLLIIAGLMCSFSCVGCSSPLRGKLQVTPKSGTDCCVITSSRQPASITQLPQIAFESRAAVFIPDMDQSILGWPVELDGEGLKPQIGGVLRNLTFDQCEQIGATNSPIAREIESHRDWLAKNGAASPTFIEAMNYQAASERNMHAGRSLEAILNLADIYSQQPTIAQSHQVLGDAERALKKIRNADVPVTSDSNQLTREHLKVEEQATTLQRNQAQLIQGLELLLELEPSTVPIWTDVQGLSGLANNVNEIDCEPAYQVALANRGDLKALETLAGDCNQLSTEQFSAIAAGTNPLLASGLSMPPAVALWWQCKLKDQVEQRVKCVKAKEAQRRREQMISLAENKRKQIRREVCDAIDALKSDRRLLNLKKQMRDSLTQSIVSAEKAKDEVPLDLTLHLQNKMQRLKLESEIIHQQFVIAADQVRLRQSQGLLGQNRQTGMTQASSLFIDSTGLTSKTWAPQIVTGSLIDSLGTSKTTSFQPTSQRFSVPANKIVGPIVNEHLLQPGARTMNLPQFDHRSASPAPKIIFN